MTAFVTFIQVVSVLYLRSMCNNVHNAVVFGVVFLLSRYTMTLSLSGDRCNASG